MNNSAKTMIAAAALALLPATAMADAKRDAILDEYLGQAKKADSSFAGFSAERGSAFFHATHTSGKPETPSCTTCHTKSPRNIGHTRAGKEIEPMAVSVTPSRFTDPAKVEKWFGRNCRSVLGRECSAAEKGDYILYLMGQ
jgi:hypothetical protein